MVNFYKNSREGQSPGTPAASGDFAASSIVDQSGTGFVWSWRITQTTSSTTSLGYSRNETPGSGNDNNSKYRYLRVVLNHQFGPKLSGAVSYQRLKNDASVATNNYTENQAAAYLQMNF
jgi:uncharacterized protein (PEP-CTERM system associated)